MARSARRERSRGEAEAMIGVVEKVDDRFVAIIHVRRSLLSLVF